MIAARKPLQDQKARDIIANELGQNVLVEAAAGTGKTTMLVERILSVIKTGRAKLDEIVAVTFTEKAAGEMKLRLREALESARVDAKDEQVRERLTRALEALEVAHIGTIHGFCTDLLRERPIEANVDPAFEVVTEDHNEVLTRAFDDWFQTTLADPPRGVRRVLRKRPWKSSGQGPRDSLFHAARALIEHRDFPGEWTRPDFDRETRLDDLVERLQEVGALAAHATDQRDYMLRSLRPIAELAREITSRERALEAARDYDGVEARLLELQREYIWNQVGRGKMFGDVERDQVKRMRDHLKRVLDAYAEDAEADLAAELRDDLAPVVERYETLKRRAGVLDFLDLLLGTRNLLVQNADVRRELWSRCKCIFVDEFQDTDPLQAEILLLLAARDPSDDDWRTLTLAPGKFFAVGDPKQSIYRFRRADVAFYSEVRDRLLSQGAKLVYLQASFRATPGIQSVVNTTFARAMGGSRDATVREAREDGSAQADYVPLLPYRDYPKHPSVVGLPVPRPYGRGRDHTKTAINASLPDAVGAFVDWLTTKSGWTFHDGERTRRFEPRDVCLLFRRFQNFGADVARPYVRALEARKVPHVLLGGRSFHTREEVVAIRAALNAIEWPDDSLHVYATLRGPFFAIRDDALFAFISAHGKLSALRRLPELEEDDPVKTVVDALTILKDLHLSRNRRPIADTAQRLFAATRAHAGFAIWPTGEQALANLMRVVDLARRFDARGATSFRAFVERLEDQAARGDARVASIIEDQSEGVRMMSIHGAKGLEFPIVVICDPTGNLTTQKPSRYVDTKKKLWAMKLAGCVPHELRTHGEKVLEADAAETVRVAYVAATRARDLLVLPMLGDGPDPKMGWCTLFDPALYPEASARRASITSMQAPKFGDDCVLNRPYDARATPDSSVKPGLHRIAEHEVLVWDPSALELDKEPLGGQRQQQILVEDDAGVHSRAADAHEAWRAARDETLLRSGEPTLRSASVTTLSHLTVLTETSATVQKTGARVPGRPGGPRFGTLVHAVLAEIPFDADAATIASLSSAHGRVIGAREEEIAATQDAVRAALAFPLIKDALRAERVRREVPLTLQMDDGTLAEGIVDLAYKLDGVWKVIDFKSDLDGGASQKYLVQVELYARAIRAATGDPAEAILLGV